MHSKLNSIYKGIIKRCYQPKCNGYKYYGGKGITVCEEWLDKTRIVVNGKSVTKGWDSFKNWALTKGYKEGLTIDRIDNNKNYCPNNCRWATIKEQENNRSCNRSITYKGKSQTLAQWCEELGLRYYMVYLRITKLKWTIEDAFEKKENADYKLITYKNQTKSMAEWSRILNIKYNTLASRLRRYKWSIEKAFETSQRF